MPATPLFLPSGTVWKIWDPAHQCHRASDRVLCGIRAENTLGLSRESGPGGSTRASWKATYRHFFQTSFSRPLSLPTFLIFPSGAFLRAPLLPLTLPFSELQGTFQRLTGIEPASQPWEGRILPMNYNRVSQPCQYTISIRPRQQLLYLSPMCHGQQTEGGQFPPSGRAVWEIRNVGCTPLPGPVQQQYRQGIRHSRAASWLLFPDQPQKEMGRCFFADCGPLREVRGFHDLSSPSVISKM